MANELRDEGRRARGVVTGLAVVSLAMMTGATATLTVDGPEWVLYALTAGFTFFAAVAGFAYLAVGRQPAPASRAVRRERAQWQRWQNCLFTWPLVTGNFALLAVHELRQADAAGALFPLMLPAMVLAMLLQILPPKTGAPYSAQRRQYDDLVDDLSREHAAVAFRAGYFALLAGGAAILAAAIYAPAWTAEVAVAAVWVGFVVPCIRFGLLQRAAED